MVAGRAEERFLRGNLGDWFRFTAGGNCRGNCRGYGLRGERFLRCYGCPGRSNRRRALGFAPGHEQQRREDKHQCNGKAYRPNPVIGENRESGHMIGKFCAEP